MIMLFGVVVVATLLVLVTSVSSLADSSAYASLIDTRFQQTTATPTQADASVAGSTDGIVWMGIVITLIVLIPMLVSRLLWARQLR